MAKMQVKSLAVEADAVAPDGCQVRVLLGTERGSMAHFELAPGGVSRAVAHQALDEIWFFLSGEGEMWRRQERHEEVVPVAAGVCVTIPARTHFQLRALGSAPLAAVGVTMPPWPGEQAVTFVEGPWEARL